MQHISSFDHTSEFALSENYQIDIEHKIEDLIELFSATFFADYNTRLIKGDDEPVYLPASEACSYHQIVFAHGYFSSGLHEIAHWCIAGKERRLKEDFGYWYEPDGRNEQQQKVFESVEVKPQAIEWAFCIAANKKFNVSADNLNGAEADTQAFKVAVLKQVEHYLEHGFPKRAQQFIDALAAFYQPSSSVLATQSSNLSLAQFK
ncbi:elongation factor P hydroxylase [Pseudocolwellia sp. AS88]|uniref:elongation factor P hydroxylase n=1 Tax=Pseudocolwellia sp. AS88 TaxID=3063958 RepID=UPI0026EF07F9|nr:elongation factor P hydroxylase [Pseudocolwellia sp. AS88]MDO7084746.1 elongation factor P hydroxylase [Pseudocolwellia sp. AS88]